MRNRQVRKTATVLVAALVATSVWTGSPVQAKETAGNEIKNEKSVGNVLSEEQGTTVAVPTVVDGETTEPQVTTKEGETSSENPTTENPTTENPTTENPTTENPTTEEITTPSPDIVDGLYRIQNDVLVEYVGARNDQTITNLEIPANVKKINSNVFANCNYIKTITFKEGSKLTEIGDYAFTACKGLTSITFPEGLKKMGYKALSSCTSLEKLTIPSTVTEGRSVLGEKNSAKTVTFTKGMTTIPTEILMDAESVENIVMYDGITTIGSKAFYSCGSIKKITLPGTVKKIKVSAFNRCSRLESVSMPSSLTTIESYAFKLCTSLKTLAIPKSVNTFGSGIFSGDGSLVLQVYANSAGKKYARTNNLTWDFIASEKIRQSASKAIYDKYMKQITSKDKKKFKLKNLKEYIPQGTSVIGKYVVVSMYRTGHASNSILRVYNKSTGAYIKTIILPWKDHVGSVTNVEGRLVIGLNNISTNDYLAVYSYSRIKKAKNGKVLKSDYMISLPGRADFAAYDGTVYWAGHSANISNAKMYGYKVKVKKNKLTLTKKYTYTVPKNTQGLVAIKGKKTSYRRFIFAQSYGRLNDSSLITYVTKVSKAKTLGSPKTTAKVPSMLEGIALTEKGSFFMVFESGAGYYCGDQDNTSEIQINNVCKLSYSKLNNLK